jgi:hypothetical protein
MLTTWGAPRQRAWVEKNQRRGLGPKVARAAAGVSEHRGSVEELTDAMAKWTGTRASCHRGGNNGFGQLPHDTDWRQRNTRSMAPLRWSDAGGSVVGVA